MVASALTCHRRPLLTSRIQPSSGCGTDAIWGGLVHNVVERYLARDSDTPPTLGGVLDEVTNDKSDMLASMGLTQTKAKTELQARTHGIAMLGTLLSGVGSEASDVRPPRHLILQI